MAVIDLDQMLWTLLALFFTYKLVTWALSRLRIPDCKGKYVLITGCDSGFGNLLAKRLDELGFNVFASCLTSEGAQGLQQACSERVTTVLLDITDEKSIANTRQFVENKIPPGEGLWGLVNNAGVTGVTVPTEWLTKEDWNFCLSINLFGTVNTTMAFLPLLRQGQGRVVNVSSMMGRIAASATPYCVSKYGVEAFSDRLRFETYDQGIKVCLIEPGAFKTAILNVSALVSSFQKKFDNTPDEIKRHYGNSTVENFARIIQGGSARASDKVHLVVDTMVLALTSRYPPARQLVGNDARFFFRILWNLPEPLTDWILQRLMKKLTAK